MGWRREGGEPASRCPPWESRLGVNGQLPDQSPGHPPPRLQRTGLLPDTGSLWGEAIAPKERQGQTKMEMADEQSPGHRRWPGTESYLMSRRPREI